MTFYTDSIKSFLGASIVIKMLNKRHLILSGWVYFATQLALPSVTFAGPSDCTNARANLQSNIFVTNSGLQNIVQLEVSHQLPSIVKSIQAIHAADLSISTAIGPINFDKFRISTLETGSVSTSCKNFDCTITVPIKEIKLLTNISLGSKDDVIIGPANNVLMALKNGQFVLKARMTGDSDHPFEFEPNETGAVLGKGGASISAPSSGPLAKGDDPAAIAVIRDIQKRVMEDSERDSFNTMVAKQINQGMIPLIEPLVNHVLTSLPLLATDINLSGVQPPGIPRSLLSLDDVSLRITASQINNSQKTIDLLLSACDPCLQDPPGPETTASWPEKSAGGSAEQAPDATQYDLALGFTYATLNRALSNIHDVCLDANSALIDCPKPGQRLPTGDKHFHFAAPPVVGFDPGRGTYFYASKLESEDVPHIGEIGGDMKIYMKLGRSADGTQIQFNQVQGQYNVAAEHNGFVMNQLKDMILGILAPAQINAAISQIKSENLPSGVHLVDVQSDSMGIRSYLGINPTSPMVGQLIDTGD